MGCAYGSFSDDGIDAHQMMRMKMLRYSIVFIFASSLRFIEGTFFLYNSRTFSCQWFFLITASWGKKCLESDYEDNKITMAKQCRKEFWKGYPEKRSHHPEPNLQTIRKVPQHRSARLVQCKKFFWIFFIMPKCQPVYH